MHEFSSIIYKDNPSYGTYHASVLLGLCCPWTTLLSLRVQREHREAVLWRAARNLCHAGWPSKAACNQDECCLKVSLTNAHA